MVMSVGICECGCSEFSHDVGGFWEELSEPEYEGWQWHRCTKQCSKPCLVARCRDSFDGDGFWVWCRECGIQCSGSFESWSDEVEEDHDEISTNQIEVTSERFETRWKSVDIGTQIQVDFSEDNLVITDAVILNNSGDLTRLSALDARPDRPQVRGFFATGSDGFEILVQLDEISAVI